MKVFAFIFAAYLLFLFAIPCCTFDNCPEDKTSQEANHEKGDGDCGSCSPFFSCEGCAAASIVYEPFHFEMIPFQSKPVFPVYLQFSLPQADIDFWQPPKLS